VSATTFESRNTPKYKIKIDGIELPHGILAQAVVDQAADMADMFALELFNDCCRLSDLEICEPERPVEVFLGYEENGGVPELVLKGDIQVVRGHFPRKSAATLRLQGYTKAFALNRDRKTRSFKTNKSYTDIANLIAGEHGLGADIDDTCTKHEYIFQRNQTDFEFLLELAEKVGFEVYVRHQEAGGDPILHFKKAQCADGSKRILKKGATLLSFNPRTYSALLPTAVQVLGWDPLKNQQTVYGDAKGKGDAGPAMKGETYGVEVSQKIGDAIDCVTHWPVRTEADAKAIAKARFEKRSLAFVEAVAVCAGMPDLRPGLVVEIQGCGDIFNGDYYVARVIHDFLPTGFTTRLFLRRTSIQKEQEKQKPPKFEKPGPAKKIKKKKHSLWDRIKFAVRKIARRVKREIQRAVLPPAPAVQPEGQVPAGSANAINNAPAFQDPAQQAAGQAPAAAAPNQAAGQAPAAAAPNQAAGQAPGQDGQAAGQQAPAQEQQANAAAAPAQQQPAQQNAAGGGGAGQDGAGGGAAAEQQEQVLTHLEISVMNSGDNDADVPGASVTISGPANRTLTSDGSGGAKFEEIPPGSYRVSIRKDGFQPYSGSDDVGAGGLMSFHPIDPIVTADLEISVMDGNDGDVGGARVTITGRDNPPSKTTDASGGVKFEGLKPGSYRVEICKDGFKDYQETDDLGPGGLLSFHQLEPS
jgi:phage protein D